MMVYPGNPLLRKRSRRLLFAAVLFALILVGIFVYEITARLIDDEQWLTHTYAVLDKLHDIAASMDDAELYVRVSKISGMADPEELTSIESKTDNLVQDLRQQTKDNVIQQNILTVFVPQLTAYFHMLDVALAQPKHSQITDTDIEHSKEIGQTSAALETSILAMASEENRLLDVRQQASETSRRQAYFITILMGIGSVISLAFILMILDREIIGHQAAVTASLQSEQTARTQYKSFPLPTFTLRRRDNDFVVTEHNSAALHFTRGQAAQWLGKRVSELYPDRSEVLANIHRCYDEQTVLRWTAVAPFPNATRNYTLDVTCVYVAPDLVMVHADDITVRKGAEVALTQERNLLRTVIDNLPDHIFAKDLQGHITLGNIAYAQFAGMTPTTVVGKTAHDVFAPDIATQFEHDDETPLRQGQPLNNVEREIVDNAGVKQHLLISKIPLLDDNKAVIGLVGINRNITRLKQIQEALSESEQRFVQLFQISPAASSITRLSDGIMLDVNDRFLAMFETSRDAVIGHSAVDLGLLTEAQRDELVARLSVSDSVPAYEVRGQRADGSTQNRLASLRKIVFKGEVCVLTSTLDITELKRAEQQATQLMVERTHRQFLADFLRDISHDLRTPLTLISSSAYLAGTLTDAAKRAEKLAAVEIQVDHMIGILSSMMEMAELNFGQDFEYQLCPLPALIHRAFHLLAKEIDNKRLHVTYHLAENLANVQADIQQLTNAVSKIVQNAVDFTPANGQIEVRLYPLDTWAVIEIRDTGIGIPSDDLPNIFEPFRRADKARSMKESHVGLGLAIAKAIVNGHRGRIEVESVADQGSIFRILLPSEN